MEQNEYDLQREERIKRNRAMLAKLQIHQKAEDVAAPLLAAKQQKEQAKEAVRKKYVATGPARQSKRAGAQRTRAKLQQQAQGSPESSDSGQSATSTDDDSASLSKPSIKRKRCAAEADFDPADMASHSSSESSGENSDSSDNDPQQQEQQGDPQRPESEDEDAEDLQLQQALAMSLEGQSVPSSSRSEPSGVLRRKPQHRAEQHAKSQLDSNHTEASAALGKGKAKAKRGGQKQRKGKSARRVGLVNPTLEEMKTAFSLFNPHSGSVINAQDIARVALEHGFNFDEDELTAMMEVAATVTQRASTTSMTFQGFQTLVENYSIVT